jgi:hypothetical protein
VPVEFRNTWGPIVIWRHLLYFANLLCLIYLIEIQIGHGLDHIEAISSSLDLNQPSACLILGPIYERPRRQKDEVINHSVYNILNKQHWPGISTSSNGYTTMCGSLMVYVINRVIKKISSSCRWGARGRERLRRRPYCMEGVLYIQFAEAERHNCIVSTNAFGLNPLPWPTANADHGSTCRPGCPNVGPMFTNVHVWTAHLREGTC